MISIYKPLHFFPLCIINPEGAGEMERFFIKTDRVDSKIYTSLNDISYYYHRHGY